MAWDFLVILWPPKKKSFLQCTCCSQCTCSTPNLVASSFLSEALKDGTWTTCSQLIMQQPSVLLPFSSLNRMSTKGVFLYTEQTVWVTFWPWNDEGMKKRHQTSRQLPLGSNTQYGARVRERCTNPLHDGVTGTLRRNAQFFKEVTTKE